METAIKTIIKTAIVEDMRDIREGLSTLINFTDGFSCTGAFRSMEEAIPRISHQVPDVLLSDIGLPGMSGIEGIRILKDQFPNMTVLMLTVYDDDDRIFDAICAGDTLTVVNRIAALDVRTSPSLGKMLIMTSESTYTNQDGKKVAVQRGQAIFY